MDNNITIGKRVKEIRDSKHLPVTRFSKVLEVPDYRIRDIEKGKVKIGLDIIDALEKKFAINKDWLLNGTGDMHITLQVNDITHYQTATTATINKVEEALAHYQQKESEENKLLKDLVTAKDEILKGKDEIIEGLKKQLESYQADEKPKQQQDNGYTKRLEEYLVAINKVLGLLFQNNEMEAEIFQTLKKNYKKEGQPKQDHLSTLFNLLVEIGESDINTNVIDFQKHQKRA